MTPLVAREVLRRATPALDDKAAIAALPRGAIGTFAHGGISFDGAAMSDRVDDYDYVLPQELIAQRPLPRRQDARMMVLDRADESDRTSAFHRFAAVR